MTDDMDAELQALRAQRIRGLRAARDRAAERAGAEAFPQERKGVVTATDADIDAVIAGGGLVFIDLWAVWCGPCRVFAPVFEEAEEKHGHRATFVKVDVDENPRTSQKHQVMSIPTLLVFKDGRLVDRRAGAMPGPMFEQYVETFL